MREEFPLSGGNSRHYGRQPSEVTAQFSCGHFL
jgi:hypothetical protein